jgi:CPA1 family monovalent cation:H+ antiporter
VDDYIPEEEQIEAIRLELAKQSIQYLDANYAVEMSQYETVGRIKEQLQRSIKATESTMHEEEKRKALSSVRGLYRKIMLELVSLRRDGLKKMGHENRFDDEVLRVMESSLDLEEARLNKV